MSELTIEPETIDSTCMQPSEEGYATKLSAGTGAFGLREARLFATPEDVPTNYIAYNPSAVWTQENGIDVTYVRVEPDRSDARTSHLGKSVVRPYVVNLHDPKARLVPYFEAPELRGEDPALTQIYRRLPISGALEKVWLLSYVDPVPKPDKPNEVATLCTRFLCGASLSSLEHIADGPEWMKDIRVATAFGSLGTELSVYGRPQPLTDSGNITHTKIKDVFGLTPEIIAHSPFIDEELLPIGSGVWGGVNDVIRLSTDVNILLAHRAWRQGSNDRGRHYESVIYRHNTHTGEIVELGILATSGMFPSGKIKNDSGVDLSDVVFTGGGHNGTLDIVTFGVRDGSVGIGRPILT